jgi:hypothetical protein
VDGKLTLFALGLMEILLWLQFKDCSADLESNWGELLLNFVAGSHNLTEVIVGDAVQILHGHVPFVFQK